MYAFSSFLHWRHTRVYFGAMNCFFPYFHKKPLPQTTYQKPNMNIFHLCWFRPCLDLGWPNLFDLFWTFLILEFVCILVLFSLVSKNTGISVFFTKPRVFWFFKKPRPLCFTERFPWIGFIVRLVGGILQVCAQLEFGCKPFHRKRLVSPFSSIERALLFLPHK